MEFEPFEPYEFMESLFEGSEPRLRYRCFRGACAGRDFKGRTVQVADRNTHNNYHNHVDEGLPNPYASGY